ncbi:MAG: prepilin-type N-terminal cleavage/methylation domain-containing protein [Candidatus Levyibacteriota bacterium]|jgi:prepilin-type N-terminal cleavage/methylation domain-containing protein
MRNKSQISNLPPAARLARGGKSQNGFTLIELIVVFTVMAILSTIGVASFVSYSRSQALNQTTSDLVQTLNTAKSLSAAQLKSLNRSGITLQCFDYQTLHGYGVQIVNNANPKYYALYIQCLNSNGQPAPITTDSKWRTTLSSDITIKTNVTSVFFPILSGGIISDGDNITLSSYGNTKTINLQNGYISVSP